MLIYLSLSYFGIPSREIDLVLKDISKLRAKSCNKWGIILLEQVFEEFFEDNRGDKHDATLYDICPKLENSVKLCALDIRKRKAASFAFSKLVGYLDEEYYYLTGQLRIVLLLYF